MTQDQTIGNLLRSRGEDSDRISSQIKEMLKTLEGPGNSGVAEGLMGATRKFHFGPC